jgi:hypothetical protein
VRGVDHDGIPTRDDEASASQVVNIILCHHSICVSSELAHGRILVEAPMVGFLILLMVVGLLAVAWGLISYLSLIPQLTTAPAIVVMPQVIAAYLAVLLGLLLVAVAGGLSTLLESMNSQRRTIISILRLLESARHPGSVGALPPMPQSVSEAVQSTDRKAVFPYAQETQDIVQQARERGYEVKMTDNWVMFRRDNIDHVCYSAADAKQFADIANLDTIPP